MPHTKLNRKYVSTYWPNNPPPPTEQLETMYKKILAKEKENKEARDAPPASSIKAEVAA